MLIAITELRQKALTILTKYFPKENAERIATVMIWADMAGIGTHGVAKMIGTEPVQLTPVKYDMQTIRDTKLSRLIDAGGQPAPLVSDIATDVAIAKAQEHGFGIVGVRGTYTSNGAEAYFVERIAREDLIGIIMARSPGSTAAFDSIDPVFGTNPIGYGFPAEDEPFVIDMATSSITWGDLVMAKQHGALLPTDVAIDGDGRPTRDPARAMRGAILPFDHGYKSSAFSMVVEIMCGPLLSSAFCDYKTFDQEWGFTVIALDPALLVEISDFKRDMTRMIGAIKASRPKQGLKEIRLPGERSHAAYKEAERTGMVDVDESVLRELGFAV